MTKRTGQLAAIFIVALACGGCILGSHNSRVKRPGDLDFKLGPFTYLEEGKLIGLTVGVESARYREKENYMPLWIGLANKDAPTLKITRESFVLQDENGKRYPLATYKEVAAGYNLATMDRTMTTSRDIFSAHFPIFERVQSNFFPDKVAAGIVIDTVELPRFHAMTDTLYFPKPDDGILGHRFELHVSASGLEEEVFVKFLVD